MPFILKSYGVAFVSCVLLAGCARIPHPFSDPGPQARKLAMATPPPRLAVPQPTASLLDDQTSALWAKDLARKLVERAVPAVAQPVKPGDWWVKMSASVATGRVTPRFVIMTPKGEARGHWEAPSIATGNWDATCVQDLDREAAPQLADLLTGIQAAMMQANPNSLKRRAARVVFTGVQGAPGDGNVALARAFVVSFPDALDHIQTSKREADYCVHAVVALTEGPTGVTGHPVQHIEIRWITQTADGVEAGVATQLHDIPAHSLDKAWGDVAAAAAAEASEAVRQIITNYSGRAHKALPPEKDKIRV